MLNSNKIKCACVFSLDDGYEIPFKVFLYSLKQTESIPDWVQIFILHSDSLSENCRKRLGEFANNLDYKLEYLNCSERLPKNLPVKLCDHVTDAAFYRLFIASLLPEYLDKAIYLDSDMLAIQSCEELFSIEVNKPIAAVNACSISDQFRLSGEVLQSYFNSGVLIISLMEWRQNDYEKAFISCMNTQTNLIKWWDQDILNIMFKGEWQELGLSYNLSREARDCVPAEFLKSYGKLIHFTGRDKPWNSKSRDQYYTLWLKIYLHVFGVACPIRITKGARVAKLKRSLKDFLLGLRDIF